MRREVAFPVLLLVSGFMAGLLVYQKREEVDPPVRRSVVLPPHDSSVTGWTPPSFPDHLQDTDQHHPTVIQEIRSNWILSPDSMGLNLKRPDATYFAQGGQDKFFDQLFGKKFNGFFIECGALDGEEISNTLFLERERGWNGLLIEADPINFQSLVAKHRNCHMMHACLSPTNHTGKLKYTTIKNAPFLSRLEVSYDKHEERVRERLNNRVERTTEHIQCFPFFSILAALDRHVDLFTLDVEGADMDVLRSIPFDKVDVDVFVIETGNVESCKVKIKEIEDMMSPFGYKLQYFPEYKDDIIMSRI